MPIRDCIDQCRLANARAECRMSAECSAECNADRPLLISWSVENGGGMRRYGMLAVWLAIAIGWLSPATAFAQATGTITGVVTDEQGAVVPGVTIEVTNT